MNEERNYNLYRLFRSLDNPITANEFERQEHYLYQYIVDSPCGILIYDLNNILNILNILIKRLNANPLYSEYIKNILTLCSLPPIITKSSDVLTFSVSLGEYFSTLGSFLVLLQHSDIQDDIIVALYHLLSKESEVLDHVPLDIRLKAAENSLLPEILAQFLLICKKDYYSKLLTVLYLLVQNLNKNCINVLKLDALNSIILRINPEWEHRKSIRNSISRKSVDMHKVSDFEESFMVLWKLLDYLKHSPEVGEFIKPIRCRSLWSLQDALYYFSLTKHKAAERNCVLSLILKLLMYFPKMDFIPSGLGTDIAMISMLPSEFVHKNWTLNIKLKICDLDYICLKIILSCFHFYEKFEGGLKVLEHFGVVHVLLKSLKNYESNSKWPQAHCCELIRYTWQAIQSLVPQMEEDFIENSGPMIVLTYLSAYKYPQENLYSISNVLKTLIIILKNTSSNLIKESILFNDGGKILYVLCNNLLTCPSLSLAGQKCLLLNMMVLSNLLSPEKHSNQIFDLYKRYTHKILNPASDDIIYDNKISVFLIDLLWESIKQSDAFALEFVKQGFVYPLLDILQISPLFLQIMILGFLTDLLEDSACIPYLLTWKGRHRVTFMSLLMRIFRKENRRLRVKIEPNGLLGRTNSPVMGSLQFTQTNFSKYYESSPSICDMFLSSRPKIYAIITLIQDRHKEKVELTKEHYSFINDNLSANDQMTMLLAENFFALKLGEAWKEVIKEVDRSLCVINPTDRNILSSLMERFYRWGCYLKKCQRTVLKNKVASIVTDECNLYESLFDAHLQGALNALLSLKYISRCTERMFRITEKYRQLTRIEHCTNAICTIDVRKTYMDNLSVTAVFNQVISLEGVAKEKIPIYKSTEAVITGKTSGSIKSN